MKKILLCVLILLVSVNVFAGDVDIKQLTAKAKNGDAQAQFDLGDSYFYGIDVPKDDKQAAAWYTKAAKQGHAKAQNALGMCYANGYGVTQNYKKAFKWVTLSAQQNYVYAQASLGSCYEKGYGVTQNNKLAYMWYNLSLPNMPDHEYKEVLNDLIKGLEQKMTDAEITEARQMTAEWLAKHQ